MVELLWIYLDGVWNWCCSIINTLLLKINNPHILSLNYMIKNVKYSIASTLVGRLLVLKAKGVGIAEDKRPLLFAIHQFFHDDFFVMDWLEQLIVFHLLHSFLKITQLQLIHIHPSFLQQTVDKESNRFDAHVTHHELVGPLVDNGLEIDVMVVDLNITISTILLYHLGKY